MATGTLNYLKEGVGIGRDDSLFKAIRKYRVTANFPSIANGAVAGIDVTCVGVVLGDVPIGVGIDIDPGDDYTIRGTVTATDTVRLTATNNSGGTVDLASTTCTVLIAQMTA